MKNKQMKAALLTGLRQIDIKDVDIPEPSIGEVLVKVKVCAVCGSDVRIFNHGNERVKYPAIIGHEIAAEVVSAGSGADFKPGERLAIGADVPNMGEDWGRNGVANMCDINYAIGYQFPGGFAQYCLLNRLTAEFGPVTRIPMNVNFEEAALCEPLACCLNGLERSFMAIGKSVLILGAGPIGILLYRAAAAYGAGTIVLADVDERRVKQSELLNINSVVNVSKRSLLEVAGMFGCPNGFDVIFAACSIPEAQERAVEIVAKRGVVNFFGGLPFSERKISISSNILHYKEAIITGSHGSTPAQHKLAMNLISSGRVEVKSLISHRFRLNEINKAFLTVKNRESLKAIINP